ncbi:MAG: hypothetical protein GF411_16115 [Candidatus Lokiarchaeota archaeon]|nr:hypothetical protein [Candidatus Lokiarchaeota archaeon]
MSDGTTEFVYLQLYRLRTMTDEEKHQWFKDWAEIRKNLPKGVKIVTEAGNAFGTPFTGFTVYEGPLEKFEELTEILQKKSGHIVERSMTIMGTKGFTLPSASIEKILSTRPID